MHVLFVHQNFPAQFGHMADHLINGIGYRCRFVTERRGGEVGDIECVQYKIDGGATKHNHYCTRTFENATRHALGVYDAVKARPDLKPDLIVGHSGFGSTLFLRELYPDVPIINYFEYFYRTRDSDMDFRKEYPPQPLDFLRARAATRWSSSISTTATPATVRPNTNPHSSRRNIGKSPHHLRRR